MFYFYVFGSAIIALLLVSTTCIIPLFLIKQFDKMTYIKGYRNNLKWYKLPLLYVRNILVYSLYVLSFGLLLIVILSQNKEKVDLLKKQVYAVYSNLFVTPLIGIGLSIGIYWAIYELLYYLEAFLVLGTSMMIYAMLLYIIIPYYVVLTIKQLVNIVKVENHQLEQNYSKFREENAGKNKWLKLLLLSPSANEYLSEYLQIFDNEQEWKQSRFVVVNYVNMPKSICIIIIGTILLNFILSFIKYDLLDSRIEEFVTNVGDPIFVLYCVFVLLVIASGLLLTLLLNWICNSDILFTPKDIVKTMRINLKVVILLVIPLLLTIFASILFVYDYSQYSDSLRPYQEQKENLINTMD